MVQPSTVQPAELLRTCRRRVQDLAASTYTQFAQSSDAEDLRLAVKIASALSLPLADLGGSKAVLRQVLAVLGRPAQRSKALQPAMSTLLAHPEVLAEMRAQGESVVALLVDVAENGKRSSAVEVARLLDAHEQVRSIPANKRCPT